jgi:hypothetical protein
MHALGLVKKERGSHHMSCTTTTPSALTSTRNQNSDRDTACASPFLNLPPELRNRIYEHVARKVNVLRLYEGRIVLPPLGSVCKQTRTEIRGIFEHEIVQDTTLEIEACVVNFDFFPLFSWLDKNDRRFPSDEREAARELRIHATCRLDLPGEQSPKLESDLLGCPTLRAKEQLQRLLRKNLAATLRGWHEKQFYTVFLGPYGLRDASHPGHHRIIQAAGEYVCHLHPRCERQTTGLSYFIGFVADSTWPEKKASPPSVCDRPWPTADFYDTMYDKALSQATWSTAPLTTADRKLVLTLLEVCQSDCSRFAMDSIPEIDDEKVKNLARRVIGEETNQRLYWRWHILTTLLSRRPFPATPRQRLKGFAG